MESNYLTKESLNNSDKFKILISMHPNDRYKYFDQLVQSILKNNDCSVYYSTIPSDNLLVDLKNINLVITGVTEKYIIWKNSGLISETNVALETQTPILPIMLEAGINNLFNTRVGKLHYIENVAEELTEETLLKINNYITSLINHEDHFSNETKPKIFISYRKQDLNELNRLINIIRSYPERDKICFWYDITLNPGDNYSHTIINQVKSCDLFFLIITPNILNPDNYCMRIEYPLAVKEKKRILPIMMQKTDLKKLYELFPNLPKCITDKQIHSIFSKIKF